MTDEGATTSVARRLDLRFDAADLEEEEEEEEEEEDLLLLLLLLLLLPLPRLFSKRAINTDFFPERGRP